MNTAIIDKTITVIVEQVTALCGFWKDFAFTAGPCTVCLAGLESFFTCTYVHFGGITGVADSEQAGRLAAVAIGQAIIDGTITIIVETVTGFSGGFGLSFTCAPCAVCLTDL